MPHEENLLLTSHQLTPTNTQQLPKGDLKTCLEWTPPQKKTSPQMSLQQGSPEVGERTLPFDIEPSSRRISPPIFFWQAIQRAISLGCSSFPKSIQEERIHPPSFNPPPAHHQKENHNFPTSFPPALLAAEDHSSIWWNLTSDIDWESKSRWGRNGGEEAGSDKGSLPSEWLPQWLALHYHVSHIVLCAPPCLRWPVTG